MAEAAPAPDTETHMWTTIGMLPRADLVRRDGFVDGDDASIEWSEYRVHGVGPWVRRDVAVKLKRGIQVGATLASLDQGKETNIHG